ncbi:MAG: hypothetical protein JXQ29_04025 [Planctomycetes bacterium]|nr:hypothetical protein [Planctomycetota bacterium]
MKKSAVLLAVLLLVGVSLGAQGYIYNPSDTPTVGSGNNWPFSSSKAAWRFSFIVDATVLPAAPVKITDLAFAPSNSATKTATQLQIRMGHTTHKTYSGAGTTLFDDVLGPCATIVYDGPFSWPVTANQWNDIGLQRTFAYDGVRNIVIEIRYNGSGGSITLRTDATIARAYTHSTYSADPYNEPNWYVPIPGEMQGPIHRLTYVKDNLLLAPDTVSIGNADAIRYVNGPAGNYYQMAASLGQSPLNLGPCKVFLDMDPVLFYSVLYGPPIFNGYTGVLNAQGGATGKFAVPALKELVGFCVYHAAVAYDNTSILGCTNTDGTQLVP